MICLSLAIIARFKISDNHARLVFTGRLKEAELGPKEVELDLKGAELGLKEAEFPGGAENQSVKKMGL